MYALVAGHHVLADGVTVAMEDQIKAQEKRIKDFKTKQYCKGCAYRP
jgi:hypothetical protein